MKAIHEAAGRELQWIRTKWWKRGKRVMIEPLALALPELSLLVLTGWHLIVLQQEAAAAAAGAAAAVSG